MIRLSASLIQKLDGTLAGLRSALQNALELEHSTIPPYLYALYSIKPGENAEIAELTLSVVLEEMLHMSLACNILNAIGGEPVIDTPSFVPTYPGHLPGSVQGGLIVGLAPLSLDVVNNTFMSIEEPEDPLVFPDVRMLAPAAAPTTIGQFYGKIAQQISELSKKENIFTGSPSKQLLHWRPPLNKIAVTDEESALWAIETIVEQGEGTKTSPLDQGHELAHYYRFSEIVHGHKLVAQPGDPGYAYAGEVIAFDPTGVWPVISNPVATAYPAGTRAALLNDTFNYTYTSLLKSLHRMFNGEPSLLGTSIALMESLKTQAFDLMSTEIAPGQNAGPTFEYHPVL